MSRGRGALIRLALVAACGSLCAAIPAASLAYSPLSSGGLSFQPQLGLPALTTVVGASPGEAPGEVWATGDIGAVPATVGGRQVGNRRVLLRRSEGTAWQVVPVADGLGNLLDFSGAPRVTEGGGVAMLSSGAATQTIITRDPGGAFALAPPPPGGLLKAGEALGSSGSQQEPPLAALDDPSHTGALLVPSGLSLTAPGVLHYDGAAWTREPLCKELLPAEAEPCAPARGLSVKAMVAGGAQESAWLIASGPGEPLMLFRRTALAGQTRAVWVRSQPAHWVASDQALVSPRRGGQMLTSTSQGVWVDARLNNRADLTMLLDASAPGTVLGRWCYPQSACGEGSLGAPLPEGDYSSFASAQGGRLGARIVSGLPGGALLRFRGEGDFSYVVGAGGSSANAVFAGSGEAPEGWFAGVSNGFNGAKVERVSAGAEATLGQAQAWPLPFRRPLTAIAPEPGSFPGDPNAQALAVGDQGQIARYTPGVGWSPEFLYNAVGAVQRPRLRGVAWPEPERAYAVGDEGEMWLWRKDTGLWEPDPAAPLGLHANLMAIAFSPLDPSVGYAVGKQGALLSYDKTWTQQAPPPGLEQATFTSIAFAGGEALATYRMVKTNTKGEVEGEIGGLIVNDGSGWRVDESAQKLLGGLSDPRASVLSKVSGLPDGGAVAAGPGVVIERDSAASPWRFSSEPLGEAQNISALAAIRAGAEVKALVSIDLSPESNPNSGTDLILNIDALPPSSLGQPPGLVGPDPLPAAGYLLKETAGGWQDLEQQAYPTPSTAGGVRYDLPAWPDAVLALEVDPSGRVGWAVGGQTGEQFRQEGGAGAVQSAAALRIGGDLAPPQRTAAPIPTPAGQATFAIGGNAQCEVPCVNLLNEGLGPEAWLSGAVARAAQIPGLRGFLYTGARIAEGSGALLGPDDFTRELKAYRDDLSAGGSLPVHAAAAPSDLDASGSPTTFASVLGPHASGGATPPGTPPPPAGTAAYAFDAPGAGRTVRVIVLDYSRFAPTEREGERPALGQAQLSWLAEELDVARAQRVPAIVMGWASVITGDGNAAGDAAAVDRVLLGRGASAYLFDSPSQNRVTRIGSGSNAIPALGTGTLGYILSPSQPQDFLGASGFLLVSVDLAKLNPVTNRAPVSATLNPSIAQLALNAADGTLLRRSQPALFQGLARRPSGGYASVEKQIVTDPYVPIPETCIGSDCGQFIAPSYTFTSSDPEVGDFVRPEPASLNPRAVLQGPDGKPIPDPHSGLFCAYNPGTTTVSITTGGLAYSEQVTVQAGSVQQPCGTVTLKHPPARAASRSAPVGAPSSPPASSSPTPVSVSAPPPPVAPAPPAASAPPHPIPVPAPFFARPVVTAGLIALPLLPPPPLARPIPPSGTSPVTAPVAAPEEQKEEEEAPESAANNMAAYNPKDTSVSPVPLIAMIVIAAGAGAGIRRRGRSRRFPELARARAQHYEWMS